ncbi:hypothetical protein N0V93_008742 [Gnomoniopsis smithogilvyi]|uniref:Uncharacterized protein n=1 Tax=Gnomoniopsis smithogilvyi TaxID=1191159 RepID=A0A9W8YQU6_9PEZI|nr:hypothetical protein N0V93_008742 [Gnomoniopsis smithogilvyi]
MVHFFLPDKRVWIFKATGMSRWFVWADVLSFLIQAAGGVMTSPGGSSGIIQIGLHIYTGGVAMQELFILCFLGLMIVFHRKALHVQDEIHPEEFKRLKVQKRWAILLHTLYAVLAFISLRIFYRIAEFGRGVSPDLNPIPYHEAYSYALDAFPMMVCLLMLAVIHPGRYLLGSESELPKKTKAEKKAEKEARK